MKLPITLFALCFAPFAQSIASDHNAAQEKFVKAFNERQWDEVKSVLNEKAVFHRATGDLAFTGPDAIVERFSTTIGSPDEWNVKIAKLAASSTHTGKDGTIVERGDIGLTAGADGSACYAGSFMMTWVADESGHWGLMSLAWQDTESDMAACTGS